MSVRTQLFRRAAGLLRDAAGNLAPEPPELERLRAVLESISDGVVTIDAAGVILDVNAAGAAMFGYAKHELAGQEVNVLMEGPHREHHGGYIARYLRGGERGVIGRSRELPGRRRDGTIFPLRLTVNEARVGRRRIFTGMIRDLTAEREHEQLRSRLVGILDASPDFVALTDELGNVAYVNRRLREGLGVETGSSFFALFEERTRRRMLNEILPEAFARGAQAAEGALVSARGDETPVRMTVMAHPVAPGDKYFLSLIAHDIAEQRRLEQVKQELISTVSHELRTPLTSIRGVLGLVASGVAGEVSDEGREMLGIALKNADRLGRLIGDFLDLDKIESGRMDIPLSPFELGPVVEQAILDAAVYAGPAGVKVELVGEPGGAIVHANADRTRQVLDNLLSNAVKFSPGGAPVEVSIAAFAGVARVAVRDRGPGVPPEFHQRIFGRFAQADASDRRAQEGSGLGLNISKALVERMGGRLGYMSTQGEGSVFFFDLPVVE